MRTMVRKSKTYNYDVKLSAQLFDRLLACLRITVLQQVDIDRMKHLRRDASPLSIAGVYIKHSLADVDTNDPACVRENVSGDEP